MFSHLSCRDELARVDNYSSELAKVKDVLAVIIMYARRDDTMRGEVAAHLLSVRDRLVKSKSIDATRIILIDGGFREHQEIELYIIHNSARSSAHNLTAPTLRPEEGRLKKSVFTKEVYRCSKASAAPSNKRLTRALATFIHSSYPDKEIRVEPYADDPSRLAVYFLETKFATFAWPSRFCQRTASSSPSILTSSAF